MLIWPFPRPITKESTVNNKDRRPTPEARSLAVCYEGRDIPATACRTATGPAAGPQTNQNHK